MNASSGVRCHVCLSCKVCRVPWGDRQCQRRRWGQAAPNAQSSDYQVTQVCRLEYERGLFHNYAQGGTHSEILKYIIHDHILSNLRCNKPLKESRNNMDFISKPSYTLHDVTWFALVCIMHVGLHHIINEIKACYQHSQKGIYPNRTGQWQPN